MKTYKLLKGLPGFRAGTIFTWNDTSTWIGGPYPGGRYTCSGNESQSNFVAPVFSPEQVEENTDWFKEITEPKDIFRIEFQNPVKVLSIEEGLTFSDGTIIKDNHEQDCCESVYADWEQLAGTNIMEEEFMLFEISGNPGAGIRFSKGYFVPCYNSQNGYYSDELELIIHHSDKKLKTIIDISEFVEDQID